MGSTGRLAVLLRDLDDYAIDVVLRYSGYSDLLARRERFDRAHELGHLLVPCDAPSTGKLALYRQVAAAVANAGRPKAADIRLVPSLKPTVPWVPAVVVPPISVDASRQEHLALVQRMGRVNRRGSIRLLFGQGTLLGDLWAATRPSYVRLLLLLASLVARQRAAVPPRLSVRPYALVVLAACRRFGHRSEPDDHASLLICRQLVSAGSCVPM
jgi:hypothetical protein